MRKTLLFFLMFYAFSAFTQIQITQSNMPSINDTIRYSVATAGSLDFKKTGANFNWDYSSLGLVSQDVYKYQALSSTPYSTLLLSGMPLGAIGYKVADSIGTGQFAFKNLYNFFEKKSSVWRAVGTGFTLSLVPFPAGGIYSKPDTIYQFPLKYNDRDSTVFSVSTPLGNQILKLGTYFQTGSRVNTVEGWGTISTPYASNVSCIKVKSVVREQDSLSITTPAFNVGFPANRVEYRWLSTTEKIPILEILGTEIGGTFTPTQIRYRDKFRAAGSNPASPKAHFTVDQLNGDAGKDTFIFTNLSRPSFGNQYAWTFAPNRGIRYVDGSNSSSANPHVVFDSSGVFTVILKATNLVGSDDSTATDMITINGGNNTHIQALSGLYFSLSPNPVSGTIQFNQAHFIHAIARVFDNNGKMVMEKLITEDLTLNTDQLNSGHYSMVVSGMEFIQYTKFIKE
ncbi:MAG TPA: T9SS type A sorting domain-containing protein [Bacteroidia bacterium]